MPVLDATDITAVTNAVLAAMNATPPNVNLVTVLSQAPTLLSDPISVDVNAIITAFNANPPNTVSVNASILPNTYKLSVSLIDASSDFVNGGLVSIYTTGNVLASPSKITSSNIAPDFYLSPNDYLVRVLSPTGFISPNETPVTILASNTSLQISLTAESTPNLLNSDLCHIRCRILDSSGSPIQNAIVSAKPSYDKASISQSLISQVKSTAITNSLGYCDLYLITSSSMTGDGRKTYHVTISDSNTNIFRAFDILVPDTSPVWLEELLNA